MKVKASAENHGMKEAAQELRDREPWNRKTPCPRGQNAAPGQEKPGTQRQQHPRPAIESLSQAGAGAKGSFGTLLQTKPLSREQSRASLKASTLPGHSPFGARWHLPVSEGSPGSAVPPGHCPATGSC